MKTISSFICIAWIVLFPVTALAQENSIVLKHRILFWNLENLFDTYNDSLTRDDEFTPEGERHWTGKRFYAKINNISKTLYAIAGDEMPVIAGFCEVENKYVLSKLIYNTPLKKAGYSIIHKDSPDRRGIDVAAIYRKDRFQLNYSRYIPVTDTSNPDFLTREILYLKGVLNQADTFHIFFNHWPSRSGGISITEPKRFLAALTLKKITDSLFYHCIQPAIILMGDFNDEPEDKSLCCRLGAANPDTVAEEKALYNLMFRYQGNPVSGTHKYQEEWSVFDQIIVSGNLLDNSRALHTGTELAGIFDAPFLLIDDPRNFGKKPLRTYVGFRYQGGFSDHLPVYIDILDIR